MRILIISIIIFLLIGGYIIYQSGNLNFDETEDRNLFIIKFSKWLIKLGGNVIYITGNAITSAMNLTWMPETNNTK